MNNRGAGWAEQLRERGGSLETEGLRSVETTTVSSQLHHRVLDVFSSSGTSLPDIIAVESAPFLQPPPPNAFSPPALAAAVP